MALIQAQAIVFDSTGRLTTGATNVLLILVVTLCAVGVAYGVYITRGDKPAPYWIIRFEHRLMHLWREKHDCMDVLSDSRPDWW